MPPKREPHHMPSPEAARLLGVTKRAAMLTAVNRGLTERYEVRPGVYQHRILRTKFEEALPELRGRLANSPHFVGIKRHWGKTVTARDEQVAKQGREKRRKAELARRQTIRDTTHKSMLEQARVLGHERPSEDLYNHLQSYKKKLPGDVRRVLDEETARRQEDREFDRLAVVRAERRAAAIQGVNEGTPGFIPKSVLQAIVKTEGGIPAEFWQKIAKDKRLKEKQAREKRNTRRLKAHHDQRKRQVTEAIKIIRSTHLGTLDPHIARYLKRVNSELPKSVMNRVDQELKLIREDEAKARQDRFNKNRQSKLTVGK